MPTIMSNRELAQHLTRDPGGGRMIVFAYGPVDVKALPDDAVIVPMHIVPLDWRHIADCICVFAHDGCSIENPIKAADHCLRFAPREVLTWRVTDNDWVCVTDEVGRVMKRVPGAF